MLFRAAPVSLPKAFETTWLQLNIDGEGRRFLVANIGSNTAGNESKFAEISTKLLANLIVAQVVGRCAGPKHHAFGWRLRGYLPDRNAIQRRADVPGVSVHHGGARGKLGLLAALQRVRGGDDRDSFPVPALVHTGGLECFCGVLHPAVLVR